MKYLLPAFGLFVLMFTTGSCKKSVENIGLAGKWKFVEQYDGYANGGNFKWNSIPAEYSHLLSFTQDGNYLKTEMINGISFNCNGTYLLQTDGKLEINNSCNTVTERAIVSELTSKILILNRFGIEGVIRYKYAATN